MAHRIINEVCKQIGAEFITDIDTGGYTGTHYYLLKKDVGGVSYYAIVSHDYGTCEMCDTQLALEENWRNEHPISIEMPPIEVYKPMIDNLIRQANEDEYSSWRSVKSLKKNFHMIFGVSTDEKNAENYMAQTLDNPSKFIRM